MVSGRIIPRLSVSVLSMLGSVIYKEMNKLPIPDKTFDHKLQGYTSLGEMPHCVMKWTILVLVLLQRLSRNLIRVNIVRIPSHFH
jgi:mRNA-degrading endonuclease YafQ of YafQ-DinJ toxin-antitoxin module